MKRSYSDFQLDHNTAGDPPFSFSASPGPGGGGGGSAGHLSPLMIEGLAAAAVGAGRGSRQPRQYQQQTEAGGKIKACMQCGTTRTPQWREGPYGPKTLCNACGVKRVRAIKAQQQSKAGGGGGGGGAAHASPGGMAAAAAAAAGGIGGGPAGSIGGGGGGGGGKKKGPNPLRTVGGRRAGCPAWRCSRLHAHCVCCGARLAPTCRALCRDTPPPLARAGVH
jgi:hypothetical protein